MFKAFIVTLLMLAIECTACGCQVENPKLTVWIRAGGPAVKSALVPFLQQVLESLPEQMNSQILICTNEGDTILEELDPFTKTEARVKVIFSNLSSYSQALTALALHTDPGSTVLTLSTGVNIRQDQIETGLETLIGKVKVYGWSIKEHGNDGSCPGKGWYHTAALLDQIIVEQMRQEGVPEWVDNGVLGRIGKYPIGGNEEIPIMVKALQKDPTITFMLNVSDPVTSCLQIATGISFQEKLERKVAVATYYMQKLHKELDIKVDLETWQKCIWSSVEVI